MDQYLKDLRYTLERVNEDIAISLCSKFLVMAHAALAKGQRAAKGLAHNQRLHDEAAQRRRVAQWRKAVQQARLARQRGEHVPPPDPPTGLSNDDKVIHNRFAATWNDRNPHEQIKLLPLA